MTKLSVVIITFNEERNIARCLDSVKAVADEIVVVDSFSTDRTREISGKHQVRFFEEKWRGYSGQKNHGHQLAENEWILSIDADEALSEALQKAIIQWKNQPQPVFAKFNRLTNYCGKWIRHCGWYPDPKLRIFNKTQACWEGEVHEQLVYKKDLPVIHLKGDMLHYSYYSIEEHIAQTNKFSSIGARQLVSKGKKIPFSKTLINPSVKFFRNYILKLGFLDGFYGFFICRMAALQTFLKYSKARQMQKEKKKKPTL
jgi:glycosyltransferase involved in cell wall biosynthesis